MIFQREIGRVTLALLCGFFIVGLAAAYWSVTGPDSLLQRGDNPRLVLADQAVARGALLDRDGGVLAQSERSGSSYTRVYSPLVNDGILGQVAGGFGTSGIEALYDGLLRGEPVDPMAQAVRDLLHEPRAGADVMLTLSPAVQEALLTAMGDHAGSAVVLTVPGGEVLAMVSQPGTAASEATPEAGQTAADSANAFQNLYPGGGALLPGLLSAAMLDDRDITRAVFPAGQCAVRLAEDDLISLQEAFLFGCTSPFEYVATGMTPNALDAILNSFIPHPANGPAADLLAAPSGTPQEAVNLRTTEVSPISMALMAAAIANDGAAPAPILATGYRPAQASTFTPLNGASPLIPVTTATTARRLQDLMRQAVAEGAAQNAGRARLDIGGLASLAGTANEPVSWFTGFTSLPNRQGAAVAVVLDGQRDAGLAADIGGAALEAAAEALSGS